jgi:hypothetical protein
MSKSGFQRWLDKFFPADDGGHRTNALVEQGLQALRLARDERAFTMGDVTRVPSRLELRISPERYDELKAMDAGRDLEFFFNDELMRDLAAENMRTFGDHAVHVTVAADPDLATDEIYAEVLAPEAGAPSAPQARGGASRPAGAAPPEDATRVMGAPDAGPSTVAIPSVAAPPMPSLRVRVKGPSGFEMNEPLDGRHWIIGRRGSSGKPIPVGYRKLDLDVRETISREQVKLDMMEDRMQIERIGKGIVRVGDDELREGEKRMLPLGAPFRIDEYEVMVSR